MRILLLMDPGILVPPKGYGGIERMVSLLAEEYVKYGHEVHLLVTTGSKVEGCIVHEFGKEGFPPEKLDAIKAIPIAWKFLWKHRNYFDLVHNFGRLIYLLPIFYHPIKKIMSYQREISIRNILIADKIPKKNMFFTGCSSELVNRRNIPGKWSTVYNGCNFNNYTLQNEFSDEAPLVFLGRIERIKGCHTAIAIAKASKHQLIIAGNISPLPHEQEYFRKEVEPHIDGNLIIYIGQVNDAQKNELLGKSKALLFPIEWNEPFGIVMIEAMACGTPVIGFSRGSVPEVIDNGITGFVVKDKAEMIEAVDKALLIDRARCRQVAETRFDASIIANKYLSLFE